MSNFIFDIETITPEEPMQIRILKNRSSGQDTSGWPYMVNVQKYKFDGDMMCPICDIENRQDHFKEDDEKELFKI